MPDSSTPNPFDPDLPDPEDTGTPEETDSGEPEKQRPRLTLKRLVVKDLEIHPHKNPDAEPIPEAQPYEEPEPEPPLEAFVPPDYGQPEEEVPPSPKLRLKEKPEERESNEEEEETESGDIQQPRSLLRLIIPLLLLGAGVFLVHHYLDPLGLKTPPPPDIQPAMEEDPNPVPEKQTVVSVADARPDAPTVVPLEPENPIPRIDAYLSRLAGRSMEISHEPEGVFINSVFYAEGMSLNPALGLRIESIDLETGRESMTLRDSLGQQHTLPLR